MPASLHSMNRSISLKGCALFTTYQVCSCESGLGAGACGTLTRTSKYFDLRRMLSALPYVRPRRCPASVGAASTGVVQRAVHSARDKRRWLGLHRGLVVRAARIRRCRQKNDRGRGESQR